MKITLLTLIFLFSLLISYSQNKKLLDSLNVCLENADSDSLRIKLLNDIICLQIQLVLDNLPTRLLKLSRKLNYKLGKMNALKLSPEGELKWKKLENTDFIIVIWILI